MRTYLLRRVLLFIPVVFFIVLFSFVLLHFSPGDPAELLIRTQQEETGTTIGSTEAAERLRNELGLDLPLFYFSIDRAGESWKQYLPAIKFHSENQFHRWLFGNGNQSGIVAGNFGRSWMTSQPVSTMLLPKLAWSAGLTLFSIFLAFLISIPIGVRSALYPESRSTVITGKVLIILYSLPAFWVASMLMFLLSNPEMINILPSSGIGPVGGFSPELSVSEKIIRTLPYLVIPTICYTYSALAFLSNNVKVSVENVLKEDYIRTARAKGLPESKVIYKHALRNALLPMITIFSGVFPMAIGGSVILESVFSIPGTGQLIYQGISVQDYPVVIAVFMITGIVTVLSYFISDVLYVLADPRISFLKVRR